MKSLYIRIWLTVVAAMGLFALVSGWMWHRHLEDERVRVETQASERMQAWAELVQRSLPAADAPVDEQAQALQEWGARLRVPLALDSASGQRIAATDAYKRRQAEGLPAGASVRLDDGRTLWLARGALRRPPPGTPGAGGGPFGPPPGALIDWPSHLPLGMGGAGPRPVQRGPRFGEGGPEGGPLPGPAGGIAELLPLPFGLPRALGPLVLVALLFVAVAAGAYPVVRRLTRRLESLKKGVEAFGRGDLALRVDASGGDEVAAVAATFNQSAQRIQALVQTHQSLLANASHELRSPLARLKMAVAMYDEAGGDQRSALKREINTNVAELDALVEEVLLASRLDGAQDIDRHDKVDLLGLAAEEAARTGAAVDTQADARALVVQGSERLLRRALRNLLENARRYGGDDVLVNLSLAANGPVLVQVCDRGPGVPTELRDRIFEPFYRLPGHAEREGGVGLGLSLVRQIAQRHNGSVRCEAREGGGSCFVLSLPRS